ncbi:hypothetical protein [Longimicrobium sp.]|jgi:hypothetical protein|uniref:hypothetical protein n=1 Tax=Longimicrobium sp. TaxID=2029185 RepID=UPI002ED77B75
MNATTNTRRTARWRAASAALFALLLPMLAGCGERREQPLSAVDVELVRADAYADSIVRLAGTRAVALTDEDVIVLGYLERLRLGLGSPFRLTDLALQDPRLTPASRRRAGAALLSVTAAARGYVLDPLALSTVSHGSLEERMRAARLHLDIVEQAVATAADPRGGELTVRAAYALAAAEGTVPAHSPPLVARAAALAADRRMARDDARALLDEAALTHRHPLALLREWRAARRFSVESPAGAWRSESREAASGAAAIPLAGAIATVPARAAVEGSAPAPAPLLSRRAARRLMELADRHEPPPVAPIAVSLERYSRAIQQALGPTETGRANGRRFVESARDEEHFAAAYTRIRASHPAAPLAEAALESAVAMRTYAQEAVWHPGFPAPSTADLKRCYGLKAVDFDADVPMAWRPYYRRMLGSALAEMEAILPGMDVRGLSIQFGRTGKERSALAIHDPYGRRIHVPPATGPGTLMHEIAHDLDWQVARRRYRGQGAYGTDVALRTSGTDEFAAAVRSLPTAPVAGRSAGRSGGWDYETRPAETFARLLDGYVTATLAARGRSNGYLSSYQDEVLAGHGTAVPPDARGRVLNVFRPLMMEASPLPIPLQSEFEGLWGPRPALGPLGMVAEVAAAGGQRPIAERVDEWRSLADLEAFPDAARARIARVQQTRDELLAEREAMICANPFLSLGADGERDVRAMVDRAARSRMRGIMSQELRSLGIDADAGAAAAAWLPRENPSTGALFSAGDESSPTPKCGLLAS